MLAIGCFVLTALAVGLSPAGALAATFTVNSTADLGDANPGNGVCATSGGVCTIRAAIQENSAPPNGQDTIVVPAGDYQLNDFNGALTVTDDVKLDGAGAASVQIHPTSTVLLFSVSSGAELNLEGVTLRDGLGTDGGAIHNEGDLVVQDSVLRGNRATRGGAIYTTRPISVHRSTIGGGGPGDGNIATGQFGGTAGSGGGIFVAPLTSGTVTVQNSTILGNTAASASGVGEGDGGGIFVKSTAAELHVLNSSIVDNLALRDGGGNAAVGGGIYSESPLVMRDSLASANRVQNTGSTVGEQFGAGLAVLANAAIERSTIRENSGAQSGGGFWIGGPAGTSTSVTDSTVFGNQARGGGAGAFVARGRLSVSNSTMWFNFLTQPGGQGGAVFVADEGRLSVIHSTLAENAATSGNAIYTEAASSGGFLPPIAIRASIIDGFSPLCDTTPGTAGIFSLGFNVVRDGSCNATQASDRPSTDPRLGPLADNGGPTQTHAIDMTSPALDLVTSGCPPPAADQRGVPRPAFAACDAGSYEYTAIPPGKPPPIGETPGPGDTQLVLRVRARRTQKLRRLAVAVECPQEACSVGAGGRVIAKRTPAASRDTPRRRLAKRKRFGLLPVTRNLMPGDPSTLKLKLRRKARVKLTRLMRQGWRARAKVMVSALDGARNGDATRLTIKLRP